MDILLRLKNEDLNKESNHESLTLDEVDQIIETGPPYLEELIFTDEWNLEICEHFAPISDKSMKILHSNENQFHHERDFFRYCHTDIVVDEPDVFFTQFYDDIHFEHKRLNGNQLNEFLRNCHGQSVCLAFTSLPMALSINKQTGSKFGWVARVDIEPNWCLFATMGYTCKAWFFISTNQENWRSAAEAYAYRNSPYAMEMFKIFRTFTRDDINKISNLYVHTFMAIMHEQMNEGTKFYILDTEGKSGVVDDVNDWCVYDYDCDKYIQGTDIITLRDWARRCYGIIFVKGKSKESRLLSGLDQHLHYLGDSLRGIVDVDDYIRNSWIEERKPHLAVNGVKQIRARLRSLFAQYNVRPFTSSRILSRTIPLKQKIGGRGSSKLCDPQNKKVVPASALDRISGSYRPPDGIARFDKYTIGEDCRIPGGKTNRREAYMELPELHSPGYYSRMRRIPEYEFRFALGLRPWLYRIIHYNRLELVINSWLVNTPHDLCVYYKDKALHSLMLDADKMPYSYNPINSIYNDWTKDFKANSYLISDQVSDFSPSASCNATYSGEWRDAEKIQYSTISNEYSNEIIDNDGKGPVTVRYGDDEINIDNFHRRSIIDDLHKLESGSVEVPSSIEEMLRACITKGVHYTIADIMEEINFDITYFDLDLVLTRLCSEGKVDKTARGYILF